MGKFLNVGIIQMPVSKDTATNLKYIEEKVDALMTAYHKPELILGVEGGIGYFTPEEIPGPITDFLGNIAKKHEIYFIPGTMYEVSDEAEEGKFFNTAPIFNPKGELVDAYRKMAPWYPAEEFTSPGKDYVVFDIPEKDTKVGVMICYDSNFPEISRNLTLLGAEVIVKLTQDPEEICRINKPIHYARALENQAYLVSTNGVGFFGGTSLYGNSLVINPEGHLVWEANNTETVATTTLDLGLVKRVREYGTCFMDHYLKHVKQFNFKMPYANNIHEAPLFKNLEAAPSSVEEYEKKVKEVGVCEIGKTSNQEVDFDGFKNNLNEFFK